MTTLRKLPTAAATAPTQIINKISFMSKKINKIAKVKNLFFRYSHPKQSCGCNSQNRQCVFFRKNEKNLCIQKYLHNNGKIFWNNYLRHLKNLRCVGKMYKVYVLHNKFQQCLTKPWILLYNCKTHLCSLTNKIFYQHCFLDWFPPQQEFTSHDFSSMFVFSV